MREIRFILLLTVMLLSGCASAPGSGGARGPMELPEHFIVLFRSDVPRQRTVIDADPERVWGELPAVYRELGFAGAPATTETERIYITPEMVIEGRLYTGERNSDYLDCGFDPAGAKRADVYEVRFALLTWVRAIEGNRTEVQTMVEGRARDRKLDNLRVPCTGTGRMEQMIIQSLRQKTGRTGS